MRFATPTPDVYPQALLGWRIWSLSDSGSECGAGWLRAIYSNALWSPDPSAAAGCIQTTHPIDEPQPSSGCDCGWYAFYELDRALNKLTDQKMFWRAYVLGAVAARGRVELHGEGWRAEQAQILGLWRVAHDRNGIPVGKLADAREAQSSLELISERYRVPVLDLEELRSHVSLFPLASRPRAGATESRRAARLRASRGGELTPAQMLKTAGPLTLAAGAAALLTPLIF